jgi:dTDP-4-amino-4,6-dideoxygalactose transaminase
MMSARKPSFAVPFIRPALPSAAELSADVAAIQQANWFSNFGPFERAFREGIEAYVGKGTSAVTFSSATSALVAALTLLTPRTRRGKVVVASFTFAAGPLAVEWAGHSPYFIDIDPVSLQPSLDSAGRALADLGDQAVAVLLTTTFGVGTAEIAQWESLAGAFGVPLIIDSAAGFGSLHPDGERLGARGDCEIFSFHATKPFAIGEGGALFTRDAELAESVRSFSNFGFSGTGGATMLGMNGKLQEMNAAIGLRQLTAFETTLGLRREAGKQVVDLAMRAGLKPMPGLLDSSVCFATVLCPDEVRRDRLLTTLEANGVEARTYYSPAVHTQPHFANAEREGDLACVNEVGRLVLSLPVHAGFTDSALERIARGLGISESPGVPMPAPRSAAEALVDAHQ